MASAASNSRRASGQRPWPSASAPRSWWISALRRSFADGPWTQARAATAASAARRGRIRRGSIAEGGAERGLEGGEEAGEAGGVLRPAPAGGRARRLARGARLREERDPLERLVLHVGGEVPEVEVVEHEPHRLEELEPLDL